jgi:hypothetical protein
MQNNNTSGHAPIRGFASATAEDCNAVINNCDTKLFFRLSAGKAPAAEPRQGGGPQSAA